MVEHRQEDLSGSRFEGVRLEGAQFRAVDLRGARFRGVDMRGAVLRGVELHGADIDGDIGGLTLNGVDVGPLVEAELDRRYPDRARMRPTDPAGFRAAWELLGDLWAQTVTRARALDPELLHESVDGEWSFIQTLRHLVFATESWVHRAVLGDPAPWHPLSLPWDEMPETPGVPRDLGARPALDTVLAVRSDRAATVGQVIDGLTPERLAEDTVPVDAPGWPEPRSYPVRDCLRIVLDEEWQHRLFAERDLAVLEARG